MNKKDFTHEEKILFHKFLKFLKKKSSFKEERLFSDFLTYLIEHKKREKEYLPVSIFDAKLSSYESIVKYLREKYDYSYEKIAKLLYKNKGAVSVTYNNAKKKNSGHLQEHSYEFIPLNIFNKNNTILENIVCYLLKEGYSIKKIAEILHRKYITIWTISKRLK